MCPLAALFPHFPGPSIFGISPEIYCWASGRFCMQGAPSMKDEKGSTIMFCAVLRQIHHLPSSAYFPVMYI